MRRMTRVDPCIECLGKGWMLEWYQRADNEAQVRRVPCEFCGGIGLEDDSDAEVSPYRRSDSECE